MREKIKTFFRFKMEIKMKAKKPQYLNSTPQINPTQPLELYCYHQYFGRYDQKKDITHPILRSKDITDQDIPAKGSVKY